MMADLRIAGELYRNFGLFEFGLNFEAFSVKNLFEKEVKPLANFLNVKSCRHHAKVQEAHEERQSGDCGVTQNDLL